MNKKKSAQEVSEFDALLSQGKRLDELRKVLFVERKLTTAERGELLRYLNAFDALTWRRHRERYPQRGAPHAKSFNDAELVRQLKDEKGARIKAAIRALLPTASPKETERVQRQVSKNRKDLPIGTYLYIHPRRLNAAISRLKVSSTKTKQR